MGRTSGKISFTAGSLENQYPRGWRCGADDLDFASLAKRTSNILTSRRAKNIRNLRSQEANQLPTHVETADVLRDVNDSGEFSLAALVRVLESQTAIPSLEQIYDWLESVNISDEELEPYVAFKDGNYWRHRVCRNEFVEMLVLCWRPGHRTPIHDHNVSHVGGILL